MDVTPYLSPPAVAAILAVSRMSAWRHFDAGNFGPVIRRRGIAYAAQAEVERATGIIFSPEQIASAVEGRPDRLIVIEIPTKKDALHV